MKKIHISNGILKKCIVLSAAFFSSMLASHAVFLVGNGPDSVVNSESVTESHPADPNRVRFFGGKVGFTQNNTWVADTARFSFPNDRFSTVRVELRVSKGNANNNARVELRRGSPTGTLIGTIPVNNTGGWNNFVTVGTDLPVAQTGIQTLYLVFKGGPGFLLDLTTVNLIPSEVGEEVQAELYDSESNPGTGNPISVLGIPGGGQKVGFAANNSWIKFDDFEFGVGGSSITLDYSKGNTDVGSSIVVRLDSPTGPILTTYFATFTGGWNNFVSSTRPFQKVTGKRDIVFVFQGPGFVADLDSFTINP